MSRLTMLFVAIIAFALGAPAHAEWWEASTDHFVIYADDKEKDVREFAEDLERYHSAMEVVSGRESGTPSPSNRVVIFVAGGQKAIRELAGTESRWIQGFYVPRAGGSRAFVQNISMGGRELNLSMIVLLHEYAHHFLITTTPYAVPSWMNEGAAEFFASAKFEKDGGVSVGRPAYHRSTELAYADRVSAEELFDPELYEARRSKRYDAFYARSWLLYHYLNLSGNRRGQISAYVQQVVNGKSSIEAARAVFGDLDQLDSELDDYQNERKIKYLPLPAERIQTGPIALRRLPPGEAAVLPLRMQSQRGVNDEEATALVVKVRAVAAQYPDDPGVLTALAEAEYDADNDDAAIAAADRAIAIDPDRRNAYVQKGYALFRKAADAEDIEAAYDAAMRPFSALNKIENDHPLPLYYYYRSFVERGAEPPENARRALERASDLAPFDHNLAMNAGMMLAGEGYIAAARKKLAPVAANPHNHQIAQAAARIRAALEDVEEGTPWHGSSGLLTADLGEADEPTGD